MGFSLPSLALSACPFPFSVAVKGAACFSVTATMLGVVGTGAGPQPEPGPPEGFPGKCLDWNSAGMAVLQQPHVHMEEAGLRGERGPSLGGGGRHRSHGW